MMMNESNNNNNNNNNDNFKDSNNDVNYQEKPPPTPRTAATFANNSNNDPSDPSPLITVDGELSDFILHGHLGQQINSDLARESINWQKTSYDVNPLPVYVEAHFVRLDHNKHLMLDFFAKDYVWLMNHCGGVGGGGGATKRTLMSSMPDSPSRFRSLHTSSLKRHHSFNSGGSIPQQQNQRSSNWTPNKLSSSGRSSIETSSYFSSSPNTEHHQQQQQLQQQQTKHSYPRLFRLIGKRYCLNNGARTLLNSYWLESNHDLESYNCQVRDDLLNWFQKILTLTACYSQVGLCQDFCMDFFVVIVVRNHLTSIGSMSHMMNSQLQQQKANTSSNNNNNNNNSKSSSSSSLGGGEQLLNLSNLVSGNHQNITAAKTPPRNSFNSGKQKKTTVNNVGKTNNTKTSLQRQTMQPLSSSMSSLNTAVGSTTGSTSPTYLTHQQLADQIRNDLLVCFQLFRQNHLANGNTDQASVIPADNSVIAVQLLERIIIFDSTSNASAGSGSGSMSNNNNSNASVLSSNNFNNNNNPLPPTNPIISSTARTFSALSNFSASSIKINPSSMMSSMSPTRNISRTKAANILSGGQSGSSSSSLVPNTTILNYSQFIMRIRHFLLEFYTKQFDCFEKLIRQIRELRIDPQWDYFGFFILQEELAFHYESLGLYGKALLQYEELDALFSQLVSNVSKNGGFGAPMWMKKRLMFNVDDDDDDEDDFDDYYDYDSMDFDDNLNELKSLKPSAVKSKQNNNNNNNYHGWTGLCLCNQKSIMNLRMSILRSVLMDDHDDYASTEEYSSKTMENDDHPLSLVVNNNRKQSTINRCGGISLLDFRNYLYARQCHLLCLLNKPWKLASRALSFLQTSVAELNMLEISMPPGGVACWVFLSVLEILHKCERYSDSSQLNSYSYHTVGLWSYARDNLIELGKICNLMPEFSQNSNSSSGGGNVGKPLDASEHLHRMVELVAGMGADPHVRPFSLTGNHDNWMSPQERLKDALSSPDRFLHHYLEITELTMGTYKHIGHIRHARSIGKQLAELYLKLNKPQQALPFLLDLYHLFHIEHWAMLKKETCQLLAKCLEQLYFNTSNTLYVPNHQSSNSGFSLSLIIRSACRAYLLLLLLPSSVNCSQSVKERDQYIEAMIRMVGDFSKRSNTIKQDLMIDASPGAKCSSGDDFSMLVIHNSYFDLLHDGLATVARSNASSVSPCGSDSNSSSHSNLPIIEASDGQAVQSGGQQWSDSISVKQSGSNTSCSNEHIDQQQNLHYLSNDQLYPTTDQCAVCANVQTNQQPDFVVIENIEIQCDRSPIERDSPYHNVPASWTDLARSKDGQSFVAGSILKLKLKIQSKLDLKMKLDKIQITIRFHPDDPESRMTMIETKQLFNDPEHESGGRKHCNVSHPSVHHRHQYGGSSMDLPKAKMEACYSVAHKSAGIKCLNENELLKRMDVGGVVGGYHNRPFDGGGHYKFMSQSVPISLLNQRLSQDDHQRYYRFCSMPLKFETSPAVQLEMLPNINEYELQCKTKEDLFTIAKQFNLLLATESSRQRFSINNVNHLWFSLDQLILFCHYDHSKPKCSSSMKFVIVEDFGHRIVRHNNPNDRNAFRLVKCPPSIELVPFNQQYNACFIGIPQLMCLHLNSGTSRLPQGLKCSAEISRLVDKHRSKSIYETPQDPIQVSLHSVTDPDAQNDDDDDDDDNGRMVSFCLDHPLEPFETYRLVLLLRSSYTKPNKLRIKGVNVGHQTPWPVAPKRPDRIDQHDFQLSLSWNWSEHQELNSGLDSKQTTGCQFTLFDAFHLQPKLCTAGPVRKFFQLQIFASKRLPNDLELLFGHPIMKETNRNGNGDSGDSTYSSPLVPVDNGGGNGENPFSYRLMGGHQLNFVWSINVETADLNEIGFDLRFKPKLDDAEADDHWEWPKTVNVSYQVFVQYEWRTRYVIRQWIEPLIKHVGAKNSEIIRVGHSCLLHLRIERYFGDAENDPPQPDEFIMYELICDPQLWSFVSTWNPMSITTLLANDPNEDGIGENGLSHSGRPSNEEMSPADTTPKPVKFSGSRMVVDLQSAEEEQEDTTKMTNDSSIVGTTSFQTAFEVMPLTTGYLPLPKVRISLYRMGPQPGNNLDGQDDSGVAMLKSNRSNSDSNCSETQSKHNTNTNNTIESLSAMLSENLSLSGKNWSKYLSPNMRHNPNESESSASSTSLNSAYASSAKNARLEPFEAGQVYNYNRASQIYVSPSNITVATTNNTNDSWFS